MALFLFTTGSSQDNNKRQLDLICSVSVINYFTMNLCCIKKYYIKSSPAASIQWGICVFLIQAFWPNISVFDYNNLQKYAHIYKNNPSAELALNFCFVFSIWLYFGL